MQQEYSLFFFFKNNNAAHFLYIMCVCVLELFLEKISLACWLTKMVEVIYTSQLMHCIGKVFNYNSQAFILEPSHLQKTNKDKK